MIRPEYLKNGDKVAIAAPARWIAENPVKTFAGILEEWGLKVKMAPNLFRRHHQFAGDDRERISGFQSLLDDRDIAAIFCARGGYGSIRVIRELDFSGFLKRPKWIVGYSDITVMHAFLQKQLRVESVHGSMPVNLEPGREECSRSLDSLKNALFGERVRYVVPPDERNRPGNASGIMSGGNLSVICGMRGTPLDLPGGGRIMLIEDVDEYLYHLDRMMCNLDMEGPLEALSGLMVGYLSRMHDNRPGFGKSAREIIREHTEKYSFPFCLGFPAGHEKPNLALIMGREADLSVGKDEVCLEFKT